MDVGMVGAGVEAVEVGWRPWGQVCRLWGLGSGCQPSESGGPGAGEGSLCEEGAARASQCGGGGGNRSGLMSKSMPFLGASIFLKGNSLSEGGFPVPLESQPEKGVCTNPCSSWGLGT